MSGFRPEPAPIAAPRRSVMPHGPVLLAAALLCTGAEAADRLMVGLGTDHGSGRYGSASTTTIDTFSLVARYDTDRVSLRLSMPTLRVRGPADVLRPQDSAAATEATRLGVNGGGDAVASASVVAWQAPDARSTLEIGARLKLPTSDRGTGLGTGKPDTGVFAHFYKGLGPATLLIGGGYKFVGKPAGSGYRDIAGLTAGAVWQMSDDTAMGGLFEARQSVLPGLANPREVTVYVTHRLARHWLGQIYVYKGLNDASPDLGSGTLLSYVF